MTREEWENVPKLSELHAAGIRGKTNFGIKYRSSNADDPTITFERCRIPNGVLTKVTRVTINGAN